MVLFYVFKSRLDIFWENNIPTQVGDTLTKHPFNDILQSMLLLKVGKDAYSSSEKLRLLQAALPSQPIILIIHALEEN